jgi:hypothetical protein
MKRWALVLAAVAAFVPAVVGVWGNESFAQDVPVRVPAPTVQIVPEDSDDHPTMSHTPRVSPTSPADESGEDGDDGTGPVPGSAGQKPTGGVTSTSTPSTTKSRAHDDDTDSDSREVPSTATHSEDTPAGERTTEH